MASSWFRRSCLFGGFTVFVWRDCGFCLVVLPFLFEGFYSVCALFLMCLVL